MKTTPSYSHKSSDSSGASDKEQTGAEYRRCCFSDALGARTAGCTKAAKSSVKYRRAVYCANGRAHATCAAWMDHIRNSVRFSLGTPQIPSALPRRTAIKLQSGGLLGVQDLLDPQATERIRDVSDLLRRVLLRFGSFDRVPLQFVLRRVQGSTVDDD